MGTDAIKMEKLGKAHKELDEETESAKKWREKERKNIWSVALWAHFGA